MNKKEKPYRLIHREGRYIQVVFKHIPGGCFSTGTNDDAEAIKWAEKKLAQDTGRITSAAIPTLAEFAKDFFKPSDPRGFRKRQLARGYHYDESYYSNKQGRLDNYILKAHGGYLIDSISDVLIEDFLLDLKKEDGTPLANNTKNKIYAAYSDVMHEAKRLGYIKVNPCDSVQKMSQTGQNRDAITEEELAKLFPADRDSLIRIWGSQQWALYFLILRDTGWRPGQVAGLSVINYYPELHGVYTTGSVDWRTRNYKNSIKTTNKGQKFCEGFLSDQTVELLEDYIRTNPGMDQMFKADNGKLFCVTTTNNHFKSTCEKLGINLGNRTQYSMRHSFQTFYIGKMPETARLLLMGHTKTRQEYSHLTPEQTLKRVLSIEGVEDVIRKR